MAARGKAIFTGCAAMTQHGIVLVLLGSLLPSLIQEFGVRESLAGLMLGAGSLGFVLGPLIVGRLIDRRGVRFALLIGFVIEVIVLLGFGFVPAFLVAVALNLFKGFGASFVETGLNVLPVNLPHDSSGSRASLMNVLHTFFGVGALLAPAAVALLIQWGRSWRIAFWGTALFSGAILVLTLFLRLPKGRGDGQESGGYRMVRLLREPLVIGGAASLFFYIGAESGMTGWVVFYLGKGLKLAPALAGLGLTLMWGGIMAGRSVGAMLARFVPTRLLVLAGAAGGLAAGLALLGARSSAGAFVLLFLFGFAIAGTYPNVMVTINACYPGRTGMITALLTIASSAGSMCFHPIIGALVQGFGVQSIVLVPAVLLGLLIIAFSLTVARMDSRMD